MSKKTKTTGIPQPVRKTTTRPYKSRAQREAEVNRMVLIGTGIIALVIVLILGAAFFVDGVLRPSQTVASAGSTTIAARDFEKRVRFERWRIGLTLAPIAQSQFGQQFLSNPQFGPYANMYQSLQIPSIIAQQTLNQMVEEAVIRQYAAANNITVSAEEIDKELFQYFGYQPTPITETPTTTATLTLTPLVSPTPTSSPTPTVSPTMTPTITPSPFPTGIPTATPGPTEQFKTFQENSQNYYKQAAEKSGLSEADIRTIFTAQALRTKIEKTVLGDPPKEEEQIKVRHILVKTLDEAQDVLTALQKGEPFATLARAISQDPGSKSNGGEYGWELQGKYVPEFEDAIWNAQVGQIVGPIDTSRNGPDYGFHIIQVMGREKRPLTSDQSSAVQSKRFDEWLNKQKEALNAQTFSPWINFVPSEPTLTELGLPESLQQ